MAGFDFENTPITKDTTLNAVWECQESNIGKYGTLFFMTGTVEESIKLETEEEYMALGAYIPPSAYDYITIRGEQISRQRVSGYIFGDAPVTYTPAYFLGSCSRPIRLEGLESTQIQEIRQHFLYYNQTFNQPIILPETVTTIGQGFMQYCYAFNFPLDIPDGVVSIGPAFLDGCRALAQPVSIKNVKEIGAGFMEYVRQFTGPIDIGNSAVPMTDGNAFGVTDASYPSYATGITLVGNNAKAWKDALPNRDEYVYRKLHWTPDYGEWGILYYDKRDGSGEQSVRLTSQAEYESLGNSSSSSTYTFNINGVEVQKGWITGFAFGSSPTSVPGQFLAQCSYLTRVEGLEYTQITSIGSNFLYSSGVNSPIIMPDTVKTVDMTFMGSCKQFNSQLVLSKSLESIGSQFLRSCSYFNQPLELPTSLTSIGSQFMNLCTGFASPITILSNKLTTIQFSFMEECRNFTGPLNVGGATPPAEMDSLVCSLATYKMYSTGVTLTGANAQAWKNALPDSTSSPFRKLIIGN